MTKQISVGLCVFLFIFMVTTWVIYKELPSELIVLLFLIFLVNSIRLLLKDKNA